MVWLLVLALVPVASGAAIFWMVASEGHLRRRSQVRFIDRPAPPEPALPR
jgi:hypothetical protein